MKLHLLLVTAGLVCASAASAQSPATAAATKSAFPAPVAQSPIPAADAQLIMIRSTLLALSHANLTNNYSVLAGLGSPNFQAANPPTKLAQNFEQFRSNRIDLAPLGLVQPRETLSPRIEGGLLHLVGLFPTQPMQVYYDLTFEPVVGQWKLYGLAVNLKKEESR